MFSTLKYLLPALIPSWRFFSGVAPSPRIEFRVRHGLVHTLTQDMSDTAPEWSAFRPRPAHLPIWRMLARLLWNPHWNTSLYAVALSERLAEQVSEDQTVQPTDHSLQELAKIIAREIGRELAGLEPSKAPPLDYLEFRLMFKHREGGAVLTEEGYRALPIALRPPDGATVGATDGKIGAAHGV